MPELSKHQLELLNAKADGELTVEQRTRLHAEMERDTAFRDAVLSQEAIEARIRDLYAPPPVPIPFPRNHGHTHLQHFPLKGLVSAAAILLAIGLFYVFQSAPPARRLDASALLAGSIADPAPVTVCDTPESFLAYTDEHLGQPIEATYEQGITLVGWRGTTPDYAALPGTRVLLARGPSDEPIVVLFQPRSKPEPVRGTSDGLSIFKASFGPVEAFEISTLSNPVVLTRLSTP